MHKYENRYSGRVSLARAAAWLVLMCGYTVTVYSADSQELELDQLLQMDLRQLMNTDISLASRLEEKQFSAPAAVYVLTAEDIRRSGHRRLPEILRMVPGLHVAKLDANKWAVSSRNSQTRFSSTMLVMIDGRHVYTPFYAGVYWESLDTFIEDIERIEVVRGPGGALWGANAVDGIINIVTKSSTTTQGAHAYGLAGSGEMRAEGGVRFGARSANDIHFRVFAKAFQTDTGEYLGADVSTNAGLVPVGADANDDGKARRAGFRMDWNSTHDTYMLQGSAYRGEFNEDRVVNNARVPNRLMTDGYNLVFNWKRTFQNHDSIRINTFYDQISREDMILQSDEATFDIDLQHNLQRDNHQLAWGLGYRIYDNRAHISDPASCTVTTPCFGVDPADKDLSTWSAFIQDRIGISDSYALIIGSKFEDNTYTDFEYQPSIRVLWTPDKDVTGWAAVTRAVRVPDRVNTDGILDFGSFTVPIGNKNQESYINYTYELGYRQRIGSVWILDGTVFYSDYRNTIQSGSSSGIDDVYGFEGYIKYQVTSNLRTELGYTYNEGTTALASGGDRPLARLPKHSVNLRAYYDFRKSMEFDALIYYVDDSKSITGTLDIPAYTRVDLRYGWRPMKKLDVSLLLTNMLDAVHAEAIDATKINTGVNRGIMLKLTYMD